MPLIIVCGQPCSGKSRVTAQLAELLRAKGLDVFLIDEDSLHLDRNQSYKDVPSEKNTRGLLKATTDRSLTKRRVVILDSLNNIKGYRYELWCIARQAATRYCVIHLDTPVEICQQWNAQREGPSYEQPIIEDLCSRFERPDSRNRWDAPLFTIHPLLGPAHVQQQLEAVEGAVADVRGAEAGAGTGAAPRGPVAKELAPSIATDSGTTSATNLLYEIEKATQSVVDRISEAQAAAGGGPAGSVPFSEEGLKPLLVSRQVNLPELRRHKRSFMKLATNLTFNRVGDPATAKRMFVDYLREQLAHT